MGHTVYKLYIIKKNFSEAGKECPEPIPFANSDPLGETYARDELDETGTVDDFESSFEDIFGLPSAYKLSEQVHQTTMNWCEKYRVMESITAATKVLAARHIVLKSLALAAIQV